MKSNSISSIVYTIDELRPIRTSIDQCRTALATFIEHNRSVDILDLECRLLNRSVYKNWNARHAEIGIQASRRTARLLERYLVQQRTHHLDDILSIFRPDDVEICLPSRGTLNQLLTRLNESKSMLNKIQQRSKLAVDHLRLECCRTNYVQYNILIMSLCSRIYFLCVALVHVHDEFFDCVKQSMHLFKKKTRSK
jgi:hypothetical protein